MFKDKLLKILKNKTIFEGVIFSLFSFVNRGFVFLLLLILANYISPAEYGYLSLFNTVVMVIGYFIAMSTEGYFSVSYFNRADYDYKQVFSGIILIVLIVSFIIIGFLFLEGDVLSAFLNLPYSSLYIALAIAFFTVFQNLNLDLFRLRKKVWSYGAFSCLNALINFILSILLVKTFQFGWQGRIYAQLLSITIFAIVALSLFIHSKLFVKPSWNCIKMMLVWGIPLIPHNATNFLRQGCDRFFINASHTIDDVGLFSFALNLANIIMMVGVGFNQSNSVDIFGILGNESMDNNQKLNILKRQRNYMLLLYLLFSLIISFFVITLVPVLLPKYIGSLKYFIPLAFYGVLQCIYFLYTNYLFYYGKTKRIMWITVCSALIHLLLSFMLTRYSLYYTCLIYLLSQSIVCFFIRYHALREIHLNLD